MQIVIKIPEIGYDTISVRKRNCNTQLENLLIDTILNGKILPKGHGRLIEADKLKLTQHDIYVEAINYRHRCISIENIDEAPTIIEAESEVEE